MRVKFVTNIFKIKKKLNQKNVKKTCVVCFTCGGIQHSFKNLEKHCTVKKHLKSLKHIIIAEIKH